MKLIALLLLALFPATASAGLLPTDVEIARREPACVTVAPGGVTGPGSGITLTNNCTMALAVEKVEGRNFIGMAIPVEKTVVYRSSSNPRQYGDRRYAALNLQQNGIACGDDPALPGNQACSTILVPPGDSLLLFTPQVFRVSGASGLLIEGRSHFLKSENPPDKPFGALPPE